MTRNRRLQSIPQPTHLSDSAVRKILVPIIDAIERRFLRNTRERVITRQDLIDLGLAEAADVDNLSEDN